MMLENNFFIVDHFGGLRRNSNRRTRIHCNERVIIQRLIEEI